MVRAGSTRDLRRSSSSTGSVGGCSSSGSDGDFRSFAVDHLDQPSILLRRAQIYALNRRMKAFEEKRWQKFAAGRQAKVDALSKCLAIRSRELCSAALKRWAAQAAALKVELLRQEAANLAETLVLAGLAEADAALLQTMPRVTDAAGVRRRYCPMARGPAADDAAGHRRRRRAAALLSDGPGASLATAAPLRPVASSRARRPPRRAVGPPRASQTVQGCQRDCCPLLHAPLPRECVTWKLRWWALDSGYGGWAGGARPAPPRLHLATSKPGSPWVAYPGGSAAPRSVCAARLRRGLCPLISR